MSIINKVLSGCTVQNLGLEERAVNKAIAALIVEHGVAEYSDLQIKEACDAAICELTGGQSTQYLVDGLAATVTARIRKAGTR